jgi:hypothetical protein
MGTVSEEEYDRLRRLDIARQMAETKERVTRGDFSGFERVTLESLAAEMGA